MMYCFMVLTQFHLFKAMFFYGTEGSTQKMNVAYHYSICTGSAKSARLKATVILRTWRVKFCPSFSP